MPGVKRRGGDLFGLYKRLKSGTAVMRVPFKKRTGLRKAMMNVVKRSSELRFQDQVIQSLGGAVGGVQINPLNHSIGQGDDYGQRQGRVITGRYIEGRFLLYPPTTASAWDFFHVMLVYDSCPNGTNPSGSDILDTVDFAGATGSLMLKNIRTQHGRLRIVRSWTLNPVYNISNSNYEIVPFNFTYQIPDKLAKTTYAAAAGAVPGTGGWYLVTAGTAQTGAFTTSGNLAGCIRYAYIDS